MGNLFRCTRCNEILWLNFYKLPDDTIICQTCAEKDKNQEKQQRIQNTLQHLTGDSYKVVFRFVEKYRGTPPVEELNKMINLLQIKYHLPLTIEHFNELQQSLKERIEEGERIQSLDDFEKELLGKTRYVHEKIDTLPNQNDAVKFYCKVCNAVIDKNNFDLTQALFGKPLCMAHQGTPYQRRLYEALKQRGITCEYEAFDGFKHVDIAIPRARIYIEIDAVSHTTNPEQLNTDLWEDEYSSKDGYKTIHYSNKQIAENLAAIADALAEVIKNRENNLIY